MAVSKRVSTVAKTVSMSIQSTISITTIQCISISFTLCNMNSSSRVSNISTSTSIGTMNCWNCSWGNSMDTNSGGNIGDTITNSMVDRDSMGNMVNRSNMSYTIS